MKWLQIHITVDQAQVDFTETLLESLGAVSVTLDDAENQDLLEQSHCDGYLCARRRRRN